MAVIICFFQGLLILENQFLNLAKIVRLYAAIAREHD